jgi:plastocyanin
MPARTAHPRPIRLRHAGAAAAAVVLALALAACGDDDDVDAGSGGDTTVTTASPDTGSDDLYPSGGGGEAAAGTVEAIDFEFTSTSVTAGAEVTFKNAGDAPHTMTADDGAFDSGRVEPGASATVTAPAEPGDYAFHCEIHPDMKATLTVEG